MVLSLINNTGTYSSGDLVWQSLSYIEKGTATICANSPSLVGSPEKGTKHGAIVLASFLRFDSPGDITTVLVYMSINFDKHYI